MASSKSPLARVVAFRNGFAAGSRPGFNEEPVDQDFARGFNAGRRARDSAVSAFEREIGYTPKFVKPA